MSFYHHGSTTPCILSSLSWCYCKHSIHYCRYHCGKSPHACNYHGNFKYFFPVTAVFPQITMALLQCYPRCSSLFMMMSSVTSNKWITAQTNHLLLLITPAKIWIWSCYCTLLHITTVVTTVLKTEQLHNCQICRSSGGQFALKLESPRQKMCLHYLFTVSNSNLLLS